MKRIFVLFLAVGYFVYSADAQEFADKEYYLIDSLVLDDLSEQNLLLIDSMLSIYHTSVADSNKLNAIYNLIEECSSPAVWPKYNEYMLRISKELIEKSSNPALQKVGYNYEGAAYMNIGYLFMQKGKNLEAKKYYELAIKSFESGGDKQKTGATLMSLAVMHANAGEYISSIDVAEKAVKLLEGTGNNQSTLSSYHNMSVIQLNVGNVEEAEFYSRKTYQLAVEQNNVRLMSICLCNFADYNVKDGSYTQALDTAFLAMNTANELENPYLLLRPYFTIAKINVFLNELDQALIWTQKLDSVNQLTLSLEHDIKISQLKSDIFFRQGFYEKAESAGLKGLAITQESNQTLDEIIILKKLAQIANANNQDALAAKYLFEVIALQKESNKDDGSKLGMKQVLQYKYDKQKEIDDLVHQQELALETEKREQQKKVLYGTGAGLLVFAFLLAFIFNRMQVIREQKTKLDDAYFKLGESKKNELAVSNLKALQSQMNPHFIFNALNSVQDLVLLKDIRNSNKFLGKFSDLIRKILLSSKEQFISLEEEVEILGLYLDLEKLRFGEEFNIDFSCDVPQEKQEEIQLPAMFIQPYIENAIKHGLFSKKGEKRLKVAFKMQDAQTLECIVEDNGIGQKQASIMKENRLHLHTGFSTEAISERIRLLNQTLDKKIGLQIIDLEENGKALGTKIILHFPV